MSDTIEATARPSSGLAIRPGQEDWNDEQRAQLRARRGLENTPDADLRLLFHYVARSGLDPFTGQVNLIHRRVKTMVRVVNETTGNERLEEREVDRYTTEVGIDGWRVIGNRAARRDGARVGHADVLYRGKGTGWQDYWDNEDGTLVACKYTLTVDGVNISATCAYSEYVQMTQVNGEWVPKAMWRKMQGNQLAKCTEALAWRKAFPADFSGLVMEDAAQSHDVIEGEVVATTAAPPAVAAAPRKASGAARNAQRAARAQQAGAES